MFFIFQKAFKHEPEVYEETSKTYDRSRPCCKTFPYEKKLRPTHQLKIPTKQILITVECSVLCVCQTGCIPTFIMNASGAID